MVTNFLSIYYMDLEKFNDVDFLDQEQMSSVTGITFESPEYKAELLRMMPEFYNKGYLDV